VWPVVAGTVASYRHAADPSKLATTHIRFQRTELVNADPDRLWQILTDYDSYPRSNRLIKQVRVLHRDMYAAKGGQPTRVINRVVTA
jgi:hypothetical protein